VQHNSAILAHGIEHHRIFGLRNHLAHDVDAFGLKPFKMGKRGHDGLPLRKMPAITKLLSLLMMQVWL
jgi:hypothetical protein